MLGLTKLKDDKICLCPVWFSKCISSQFSSQTKEIPHLKMMFFSAEALVPSPLALALREKESNKQISVLIHFSETENSVKSKIMSWEQNRNLNLPKVQKLNLQRVQKLQLPDPMNQSLPNGKLPSTAPAVSLVAEESRPDTSFANRLDESRLINWHLNWQKQLNTLLVKVKVLLKCQRYRWLKEVSLLKDAWGKCIFCGETKSWCG